MKGASDGNGDWTRAEKTPGDTSSATRYEVSPDWNGGDVSLYLERCQIDTPLTLVEATWRRVTALRPDIGKVVDFGAGDGRFAHGGRFKSYVGFEIDSKRVVGPVSRPGPSLSTHVRSQASYPMRICASATPRLSGIRTCQMVGGRRWRLG